MKCTFCGENEAETEIPSPNHGDDLMWDVCNHCDEYIEGAQLDAMKMYLEDKLKELKSSSNTGGKSND